MRIQLPKKLAWVFAKPSTYKAAYGGRGGAKSVGFALMLLVDGMREPMKILCARELQNSIKDSVLQEIIEAINLYPELTEFYDYGASFVRGKNGTEFIFKGIKHNHKDIKSTAKVKRTWVEEAEAVSEESWRVLLPTVLRTKGSEVWLTWNPENEEASTNVRFIEKPPKDIRSVRINYYDNPWFPGELDELRKRDFELNPDTYPHIWEGEYLKNTDAQIFKDKWIVEEFEDHKDRYGKTLYDKAYYGSDFGFSRDPTCIVRCYIYDRTLYVTHEAGGVGVDIDRTGELYGKTPCTKRDLIRADNARPETISYIKKEGWNIISVRKWPGSVEDGIAHIRSYEKVVIHPRCRETIKEFKLYSYKIDKSSGDVTRKIVDANNHYIDALRYALDPMIKSKMTISQAMKARGK